MLYKSAGSTCRAVCVSQKWVITPAIVNIAILKMKESISEPESIKFKEMEH